MNNEDSDKRDLQESYFAFSKMLSVWLVTYGVGFIAFMASNDTVVDILKKDKLAVKCIFIYAIIGLFSQIISTFFYKIVLAYLSEGELKSEFKKTRRYGFYNKVYHIYFLEFLFDVVTIVAYGYATFWLFDLVFSNA